MNSTSGIIDNEAMYFYKLNPEKELTILFGWFKEKKQVGLFIIKNFQEENEITIYDSQEDDFLQSGKHKNSLAAVQIRYLEDTIAEVLGPEFKVPVNFGYDIYLMIMNERISSKRNARKKSERNN